MPEAIIPKGKTRVLAHGFVGFGPQSGSSIVFAHTLRQHVAAGAGAEEAVHLMAAAKQRERAGSH